VQGEHFSDLRLTPPPVSITQPARSRQRPNSDRCRKSPGRHEQPRLYFDHTFKVGDAYQLAQEVRRGLEQMNVVIH
jgi:hypothetical protein